MSKIKLKALLIPKEFEQIDASNIDPRKYVKFLYLVDRTANIESLEEGLITRFSKRYPRERKLRVLAFQNKDLCDLDPEFAVEDVFNESNDELRVLVDNKFKSITYTPEPAISTPINFSQAETIRGGVYSTVDITDDKTTPKKSKQSPLSSPVSLAPPPESRSNRKIPQKKKSVSSLKQRITSGMLEAPPATPMNNPDKVYFDEHEVSSGDEYKESEESAAETADYEPEEEEKIQPEELLSMYEELDFHENDDLPLSQTSNPKHSTINKALQIDMVEGNPAMYLSRTKRRAAREANLVFTSSKKAAKTPSSTPKPASTIKTTPKPGKVQKSTPTTKQKHTSPVVGVNGQSKSLPKPTQTAGTEKKSSISTSSKQAKTTVGKAQTKATPVTHTKTALTTTSQSSNKALPKSTNKPSVSKSTLEDLYDRMKVFGQKVKTLMVHGEDGNIIGYEKIPNDFGDGIQLAHDISSEAIDTALRLTVQKDSQDSDIVKTEEKVSNPEPISSNPEPSLQPVEKIVSISSDTEVKSKTSANNLDSEDTDDIVIKPPVKNRKTGSTKAASKDLDSDDDLKEIASATAPPNVTSTKPISKESDSHVANDNGSDSDDIDIKAADAAFVPAKNTALSTNSKCNIMCYISSASIVNNNAANESDSDDIDIDIKTASAAFVPVKTGTASSASIVNTAGQAFVPVKMHTEALAPIVNRKVTNDSDSDDMDIDIKTAGAAFVPTRSGTTETSAPIAIIVDSSEEETGNNKTGNNTISISREQLKTFAKIINKSKMGSGSFSNNSSNGQDVVDNKIYSISPHRLLSVWLNYDDNESYIPKSFASNFRAHERKTQALGSLQIVHQDPVVDKTPTKNYELASDNMLSYIYVGDSGGEDINAVGRGIDDRSRGYNKSSDPSSPFGKTDTSSSFLFGGGGSSTNANTSIPKSAFGAGDLFATKPNNGNGTNNRNDYSMGNIMVIVRFQNGTGATSGSVLSNKTSNSNDQNSSIPSAQQQANNNINSATRAALSRLSSLQNLVNSNKRSRPDSESEESDDGEDEEDEDHDEPERVRKKSKLIASTPIPKPIMTPLSGNGNKLRSNLIPWSSKAKPIIPKPIPAPDPTNENDEVKNKNPREGAQVIDKSKNRLLSSLTDLVGKGLPDVKDKKTVAKKPLTIFGDSSDSEGHDDSDSSDSD
ncbi:Cdc14 phosphatase binding protein N-terminus family protein [Candida albicans]|uniref:Cdc14 phosphatase binding protein N-terminus family protein n=1 Tax=Candida albicans TaxID=5476 RepID=A0A8H6C4Y2_CANAX|nr:Cdc14 phosphatase binding protein N-terminus family protein [Candida albicans]